MSHFGVHIHFFSRDINMNLIDKRPKPQGKLARVFINISTHWILIYLSYSYFGNHLVFRSLT